MQAEKKFNEKFENVCGLRCRRLKCSDQRNLAGRIFHGEWEVGMGEGGETKDGTGSVGCYLIR